MRRKEETLKQHPYKISQGKDGKWRTHIRINGKMTSLCKNTQEELNEAVVALMQGFDVRPTVENMFYDWLNKRHERRKISDSTYHRYIQDFDRFFGDIKGRKIEEMIEYDFEDFLEDCLDKYNLTAKAFSNLKTIVRGSLKRAKKLGYIDFNVEVMLQDLDVSDKQFRRVAKKDEEEVFNDEEMDIIIRYLKENPTIRNLGILLIFLTGMRVGELVALESEDLDVVNGIVSVSKTETRYKKDGKYVCEIADRAKTVAGIRKIPVPKDYRWVLSRLRSAHPFGGYIFTNEAGERLTAHAIRMRFKRVCHKLGIKYRSVHKIRKTYGSILLDNHMNEKMVIGLMGHTDVYCTEKYYHKNRASIQDAEQIVSQIPEFCVN